MSNGKWRVLLSVMGVAFFVSWAACQPTKPTGTEPQDESTVQTEQGTEVSPSDAAPQEPAGNEPSPEPAAPDTTGTPDAAPPEAVTEATTETAPPETAPPETAPPEPWTSADPPAPKSYSGGTCPTFAAGSVTIKSGGLDRKIDVFLPTTTKDAPLLFLWHGLGDTPANFASAVGAAQLAASKGFIVVLPTGISGPKFPPNVQQSLIDLMKQFVKPMFETWSFFGDPSADAGLFDDVLSCMEQQFDIDNKRVYTAGFSAGALWSTYLTLHRSEYLAASLLLSGGTMDMDLDLSTVPAVNLTGTMKVVDIPYQTPRRKLPVMLTAGGSTDVVSMGGFLRFEFQQATDALGKGLVADGHFVIQCNHTEGHTVPAGVFSPGVEFLLKHVYSNQPSPYAGNLPSEFPAYCKEGGK